MWSWEKFLNICLFNLREINMESSSHNIEARIKFNVFMTICERIFVCGRRLKKL